MSRIYVGTCSWSEFTSLYPPGLPANEQITYYARRFSVVEVDVTYYRMMPLRNAAAWAERTPEGFVFDVKAFRQLTFHDREQPPTPEVSAQFSESVQPLRAAGKLGALHFQFAPWFTYGPANLDYLVSLRGQFSRDQLMVEFRHRSWYDEDHYAQTVDGLRGAAITLSVVDEPQLGSGSVPTVVEVTNPSLATVRLHGRNREKWYKPGQKAADRFDYLYSGEELHAWVPLVGQLADKAEVIHILFNNNVHDYAVRNGEELRSLLKRELARDEVVTPAEG